MKAIQAWFVALFSLGGCSQVASPSALKCELKGERMGPDGKAEPFTNRGFVIVDEAKRTVLSLAEGDKTPRNFCEERDSCSVDITPDQIAVVSQRRSADYLPMLGSVILVERERAVVNRRTGEFKDRSESVANGRSVTNIMDASGSCEPAEMPALPKPKF